MSNNRQSWQWSLSISIGQNDTIAGVTFHDNRRNCIEFIIAFERSCPIHHVFATLDTSTLFFLRHRRAPSRPTRPIARSHNVSTSLANKLCDTYYPAASISLKTITPSFAGSNHVLRLINCGARPANIRQHVLREIKLDCSNEMCSNEY